VPALLLVSFVCFGVPVPFIFREPQILQAFFSAFPFYRDLNRKHTPSLNPSLQLPRFSWLTAAFAPFPLLLFSFGGHFCLTTRPLRLLFEMLPPFFMTSLPFSGPGSGLAPFPLFPTLKKMFAGFHHKVIRIVADMSLLGDKFLDDPNGFFPVQNGQVRPPPSDSFQTREL